MDFSQAIDMAKAHAWLPLISLVLGFCVRMLKSDTIGPVVPAQYRSWVAWGLGAAVATVDFIAGGGAVSAAIYGFGAPALAILGHVLGIERLRDGEELPMPSFLTRKPDGGVGKGISGAAILLLVSFFLGGCSSFLHFNDGAKTVIRTLEDAAKLLCLAANAEKAGVTVDELASDACQKEEEWRPFVDHVIAAERAGAVQVGLRREPLTPENATPDLGARQ
jgi:hypothetical protein